MIEFNLFSLFGLSVHVHFHGRGVLQQAEQRRLATEEPCQFIAPSQDGRRSTSGAPSWGQLDNAMPLRIPLPEIRTVVPATKSTRVPILEQCGGSTLGAGGIHKICSSSSFYGTILGNACVQPPGVVDLYGMVTGDLYVFTESVLNLYGMVIGDLYVDAGATATIYGTVIGNVESNGVSVTTYGVVGGTKGIEVPRPTFETPLRPSAHRAE